MKKLFIFLTMLVLGIVSSWADSSWAIYSADLTQYGWTAMGENTPTAVTALGSYVEGKPLTAYYRTENITVSKSNAGVIKVLFRYTSGSHRLECLGVDLLDKDDKVVGSDYHFGFTGGNNSNNVYTIENVSAGSYKLRYIINGQGISNSVGSIRVSNDIWNITSQDLTKDSWSAMGEAAPSGLPSGSYTPFSRTQDITISSPGYLEVLFTWHHGGDRLEFLGVDLLDGEDNVVASDYHYGRAGTSHENNLYLLSGLTLTEGTYKLRYIINKDANLDDSQGKIKINRIAVAGSYDDISQWYVLRVHTNNGHYMYYDNTATYKYGFTQSTTGINSDSYLWGFVKSGDGVQVYNKAAGNTIALDDNNPSTVSANGVAADFAFTMGKGTIGDLGTTADAYFTLIHTTGKALNYSNNKLQQWTGSDAGSTFMIYEAESPATISFTLTDTNGATYSGTYTGMVGVTDPPIAGCSGYSLTNTVWNGNNYTANIGFPFSISSNSKTNYTYIGSFNSSLYYWYADNDDDVTSIWVQKDKLPVHTNYQKYDWSIEPTLTSNTFTFKIKNRNTGTYVTSTSNDNSHERGVVTLTAGGTGLTWYKDGSNYRWKLPTNKQLSIGSSTPTTPQRLGTWGAHNGTAIGIFQRSDFETLIANFSAALSAYAPYDPLLGTGLGQYSGENASAMHGVFQAAQSAQTAYTASALTSNTTLLSDPATKLTINQPVTGKFYRFKGGSNNKYISNKETTTNYANTTEVDQAIFYLDTDDSNNYLLSYATGLYNNSDKDNWNWGTGQSNAKNVTFAQGNLIGYYTIKSSNVYFFDYKTGYTSYIDRSTAAGTDVRSNKWTIEEVTSLPVTFNSAALGYATFNSPVALKVPTDVKAYVCKIEGSTIKFFNANKYTDGDGNWILPANTAVLLYNKDYLTDETKDFTIVSEEGSYGEGENKFEGTVAAVNPATGCTYYSLRKTKNANTMGFYQRTSTAALAGFRAWIVDNTGGARNFTIVFDGDSDPTGIVEAMGLENDNVEIYDLNGRKLSSYQKGINIINGKKIFK